MKIPFEEWILQKHFGKSVGTLFDEAFTCYKNSAYRASLLFSYLGFLTILKEVIVKSTKPSKILQGRWDNIISNLQADDTWEKTVYEELVNSKAPIYNINDDLRQQIKYWKDRRNDCAHFKNNDIESHHTESFWSFVKSNLLKITLEGGKESLLKKFEMHFDPTFTPPGTDMTDLVKEIDESIDNIDLYSFWNELINTINQYGFISRSETIATKVVKKILECCSEGTRDSLATFLKEAKYDLIIVSLYPDKINSINYTLVELREIWRTRIFQHKSSAFSVYGTLLRNTLIPEMEIKEANKHVIENMTDYGPEDGTTHLALASNGFGDLLFEIAIKNDRLKNWFNWVNPRADMIAYYIESYPLREETVEVICEMYTRSRYSHWLGERIEKIFAGNSSKKNEFHRIATDKRFAIPEDLK